MQKKYMLYKQMQKYTTNAKRSTHNSKTCTNMQLTYQTNNKNIKNCKNNMLYKQMQKANKKC